MMIDSTAGVTLAHIVAECRKVKRMRGSVGTVAIDYLTLMKTESAERRDIAYGDITTGLKNSQRAGLCCGPADATQPKA